MSLAFPHDLLIQGSYSSQMEAVPYGTMNASFIFLLLSSGVVASDQFGDLSDSDGLSLISILIVSYLFRKQCNRAMHVPQSKTTKLRVILEALHANSACGARDVKTCDDRHAPCSETGGFLTLPAGALL